MPTYDFRCLECEEHFEYILPIAKRDEPTPCPHCKGESKRMISLVSHSFAEGHSAESSKPDRYWENAEREKQRRIKEKAHEMAEKSFYNDPSTPAKYKNALRDSEGKLKV